MPTLLDWLIKKYPTAKRQTLRDMLASGRISINGRRPRNLKEAVGESDRVVVARQAEPPKSSLEPLKLIHEDGDILVVYKPPGLLTSTVVRERRATAIGIIRNYLADHDPKARPGIVHRLDRDAS